MDKLLVEFLRGLGYTEINDSMSTHINTWESWYKGKVRGFHDYKVYNSGKHIPQERKSLQLGKSITEQMANMLYSHNCKITVSDPATDDFFQKVYKQNNMQTKLNESQERKSAYGTVAYIPYYANGTVKMNYVTARNLIPLSFENGIISELAVYSTLTHGGKECFFMQLFVQKKCTCQCCCDDDCMCRCLCEDLGEYLVLNMVLEPDEKGEQLSIIDLKNVPSLKNLAKEVDTHSLRPPFVIDRLNIANNIDIDNPLGLALFANAIDTMQGIDIAYDSLVNEFILGKKRVMVSTEAMNIANGEPVFDTNEIVFYQLPQGLDMDGNPFVKEMDFTLRVQDHEAALQLKLNKFSSQVGFGENFYRYSDRSITTATQVVSENNVMLRTIKKHETLLEETLQALVRLIISIGIRHNLAENLKLDADVIIKFDDSIMEDKGTEIQRRLGEVSAGLLDPVEYMMWRYGLPKQDAILKMPQMEEAQELSSLGLDKDKINMIKLMQMLPAEIQNKLMSEIEAEIAKGED